MYRDIRSIKESDWKIFKCLRPLALQRYCERLMNDVDKIIHQEQDSAHERYLKMFRIVHKGDDKLGDMFNGFSRSKAVNQLVMYYGNGLLNDDEISQLSSETRERVMGIIEILRG